MSKKHLLAVRTFLPQTRSNLYAEERGPISIWKPFRYFYQWLIKRARLPWSLLRSRTAPQTDVPGGLLANAIFFKCHLSDVAALVLSAPAVQNSLETLFRHATDFSVFLQFIQLEIVTSLTWLPITVTGQLFSLKPLTSLWTLWSQHV